MKFLETVFGKKNAKNLSPSRRAQIFGVFFPKMFSKDLHGTLYLWLIDDLFPLVFGLRFPLDFFEVKKLKLGGPFWKDSTHNVL